LKFQAKTYQHTQRIFRIHSERYKRVEILFYWIIWSSWALFSEDVQKYFIWVLHYVKIVFSFITSSSQERDHFLHFLYFCSILFCWSHWEFLYCHILIITSTWLIKLFIFKKILSMNASIYFFFLFFPLWLFSYRNRYDPYGKGKR
jgi:hypothetical protein